MDAPASEVSDIALLDSPDLVCVATTRDRELANDWRAALERANMPVWTQTITVRETGQSPTAVYLLYVRPGEAERAMRVLGPQPDLPIFPLAHLRHSG
ncbi:MAG: hypothetical protein QJR03_00285 [Sphaerobacter sp.]|nr:hypothetical protein [Sphaerobacter sp.]